MEDMPLLHAWFNAPHAEHWSNPGQTLEAIREEYGGYLAGKEPISSYSVLYGDHPIGLMQWVRMADYPEIAQLYGCTDLSVANCDVILGDPAYVHRGLGAPMIRRFLAEYVLVHPEISGVVIDPYVENKIAIRAYEKAGFTYARTALDDGDGRAVYLMEMTRSSS